MLLRIALALLLLGVGCASQVESSIKVTPPSPAPTSAPTGSVASTPSVPTDADGDNVTDDRCPEQAETKNGFEDEDGCPDEVPDFYVSGHAVVYQGEMKFGLLGGLQNSSQPAIDGLAALFAKHGDVELVEVAAHLDGSGSDQEKKSRARAESVVKALVKAGVDAKRLRATGYGNRCPEGGARIELKILRAGGADTGVALCGQ